MKLLERLLDIPAKLRLMTWRGLFKVLLLLLISIIWVTVVGILLGIFDLTYVIGSILFASFYILWILCKRLW